MGLLVAPPSDLDLKAVQRGTRSTVSVRLRCGECDGEWGADLEPKGHRESTCPHCGANNRVFREWTIG